MIVRVIYINVIIVINRNKKLAIWNTTKLEINCNLIDNDEYDFPNEKKTRGEIFYFCLVLCWNLFMKYRTLFLTIFNFISLLLKMTIIRLIRQLFWFFKNGNQSFVHDLWRYTENIFVRGEIVWKKQFSNNSKYRVVHMEGLWFWKWKKTNCKNIDS